ncbi:MAG: helix-turn-helix domain-containing protein, partial [Candidatus Zixiibacteriota bacterium]
MQKSHEKKLKKLLSNLDEFGNLKSRESTTIEFKEKFNMGSCTDYGKTLASFANHRGGYIIFGVSDSPRKIKGINYDKFNELKQEKITQHLNKAFSPSLDWDMGLISLNSKHFGYIFVDETARKPVVCKINGNSIKDGDIYYRYRGQTKVIAFPELSKILEESREKERNLWRKHIENIAQIGPQNIALVDLLSG